MMPSNQVNKIINDFMSDAKQALAQIIASMQSDQLLQQMRNDENLYEQKINYIKEIIKDKFTFTPINDRLVEQIKELKQSQSQMNEKLENSKQQYLSELGNIQIQYKQFLIQKENEKKNMERLIEQKNQEILSFKKDFALKINHYQQNQQQIKKQMQTIQMKQNDYQIDIEELQKAKLKLKEEIRSLKSVQKQQYQRKNTKNSQLQNINFDLKTQVNELNYKIKQQAQNIQIYLTQEQQYINTIQKMKEDMFLIKQEWQKRCNSISKQLNQDYLQKIIQHQSQMNQKLQLYIEDLKMGKNIIIQSSEQILQSKKILMQQKLDQELKRYQNQLGLESTKRKEIQQQYEQLNHRYQKLKIELFEQKKNYQIQIRTKQQSAIKKQSDLTLNLTTLKNQSQKEIQRLHKTQAMLLKDLKVCKQQKEEIQKQVSSIRNEFNIFKQKMSKQSKRLKQLEQINQSSTSKIIELKKDVAIANQKSTINERSLKDKNNEIFRLQSNLNQIRSQCKQFDNLSKKLQLKVAEYNLKLKQKDRIQNESLHKIEKLYILVRKISKQLTLTRQDILFYINVERNKLATVITTFNQQFKSREQSLIYKHKLKLRQLLDQVDLQKRLQGQQFDMIARQNQNMKKQIAILEQVMREKEEDHVYNKSRTVNLQVQKCRLLMQQDIARQRQEKRKIQEKLYNQQKNHQYLFAKAEKQLIKNTRLFMSKWQTKLVEVQENLQTKDKYLKQTSQHLKKVMNQLQIVKESYLECEQKLNKHQKKYQSLKQERDRTVDQMMKRLQKQTKHKLSLQRQLKQIRGQIIKTQTNTTSSPFNNYSFTDRQNTGVYTNAFQATQQKSKFQKTNQRQKQLSEIRQMIAKTYKVVEGPEKDSPIHKGKLF